VISVDDKEFLLADIDPAGISPYRNNLYVAFSRYVYQDDQWHAFFARSTDQAGSWTNVRQLSSGAEGLAFGTTVAAAPNGDVYVAYHSQPDVRDDAFKEDGLRHNPNGRSGQVVVFRSTDGGVTFPQRMVAFTPGQADVTFNAQDADNGGNIPGTQFWTLGSSQPWVLADPVRPGTIYVITADDTDNVHGTGDDADVVLARSTDYGLTWTVSTVEAGPVDEPGTLNNSFQLFPTAVIDPFGNLVVAWYDNRRGLTNSAGRFLLDVFAKYSTDGGLTWSDAFMVPS
jgi:hypothetical protein